MQLTPEGEVHDVEEDETAEELRPVTRSCCGRPSSRQEAPVTRGDVWMVRTSLEVPPLDGMACRITLGGDE